MKNKLSYRQRLELRSRILMALIGSVNLPLSDVSFVDCVRAARDQGLYSDNTSDLDITRAFIRTYLLMKRTRNEGKQSSLLA